MRTQPRCMIALAVAAFCVATFCAATAFAQEAPQRVRVGGSVQQSLLVHQERPVFPPLARQARIQGTVRLQVIVAADGKVAETTVVSGHPLLQQSAIAAVSQWEYKPTLLNGKPVEVVTTVDVVYALTADGEPAPAANTPAPEPAKHPRVRLVRPTEDQLIKYVEPEYPMAALLQGTQGPVQFRVTLDADGKVEEVEVTGGRYELGEEAESAIRQWVFRPPEPGAAKEPVRVTLAFEAPPVEEVRRQIADAANAALAQSPESSKPLYHLGLIAKVRGDFAGALTFFRKALDVDRNYKPARSELLDTLRENLFDVDALALELRAAAAQYPGEMSFRVELSKLLMDLDDLDGAIAEFGVLRSMAPDNMTWCSRLAFAHYRRRGAATAAAEARRLSATCGDTAEFYAALGQEFLQTGQIKAAASIFEETLKLNPENQVAKQALRELAEIQSAAVCAQPKLVAVAAQKGSPLGARLGLAAIHYVINDDLEGALERFRDTLRAQELPTALLQGLAEGLKEIRGLDFAIRESQRWIAVRPNASGPYVAQANLLLRRGRVEEALVMARHAVSLNPRDEVARGVAASALRAQGKTEEARLEVASLRATHGLEGELGAELRAAFQGVEEAFRSCIDSTGQRTEENRHTANEVSAVASLRTLNTVNVQYAATYGGFASSLAQFGPAETATENAADLIDTVLASGKKNGYFFIYSAGATDEKGKITAFTIHAEPIDPDTTGKRFFFIDQSGVIRFENGGRATASSPPLQ